MREHAAPCVWCRRVVVWQDAPLVCDAVKCQEAEARSLARLAARRSKLAAASDRDRSAKGDGVAVPSPTLSFAASHLPRDGATAAGALRPRVPAALSSSAGAWTSSPLGPAPAEVPPLEAESIGDKRDCVAVPAAAPGAARSASPFGARAFGGSASAP